MKKNKVLLFLVPFAVILMGVMMYLDEMDGKKTEEKREAGIYVDFGGGDRKNEDKLSSRRDRMQSQYQDEAKKRRHTKPDEFFSAAKEAPAQEVADSVVEEVANETPVQKSATYYPQRTYVPKKQEEEPAAAQYPTSRRRVGFAGSTGGTQGGASSSKENHDTKILVVVHRAVTVKNGQVVKLRVVDDVVVSGLKLNAGTFIDGIVRFGSSRLHIDVEGLNVNGNLIKKKFTAYSLTGLEGLEVNGSISAEAGQDAVAGSTDYVERRVNLPVIGGVVSRKSTEALKEQSIPIDAGTKLFLM